MMRTMTRTTKRMEGKEKMKKRMQFMVFLPSNLSKIFNSHQMARDWQEMVLCPHPK
jgi:hypothetical protein